MLKQESKINLMKLKKTHARKKNSLYNATEK